MKLISLRFVSVHSAAALFLAWWIPSTAAAATYYVSTHGDNSAQGTETHPWKTVTWAAGRAGAGDTVYVREGTYREKIVLANTGAKGAYLTFAAYPGELVTIDGTSID